MEKHTGAATLPVITITAEVQFIEGTRDHYDGKEEESKTEKPQAEN